ncbi:hypothetical protein HMPREF0372_00869 [Flavonifractor plautii ATCC 29863]|uniref:Uncharacterized protein n=1 Tax=Flavonifractor plautii ATCC 29863 TaxID=411475 RepID=G9YMZ7_FLAPL|nr:hypothetical protein HMPREF0372_00869 [Flavonifractor plautii ATCC 29863]
MRIHKNGMGGSAEIGRVGRGFALAAGGRVCYNRPQRINKWLSHVDIWAGGT